MSTHDEEEVIATVRASSGRRILGMVSLSLLGLLLLYVAFAQSPDFVWRVFLVIVAAASLWVADAMRRATASVLELTETELRDADGTQVALIADIVNLDRGFFAFKPSNGFLIKTKDKAPRRWRPGLWWRVGNRIGVGGMTSARQTKNMSEILAIIMAKRDLDL